MKKEMTLKDCDGCPGLCCQGLEESILKPRTKQDHIDLRWQLHFENTNIFIRSKRWYQLTLGQCQYLGDDYFCSVYEDRPQVCRDHTPPECERYGDIFDVIFKTPEDFDKWKKKEERKKKGKKKKRGKAV